jgi:hypothetical protein
MSPWSHGSRSARTADDDLLLDRRVWRAHGPGIHASV